MLAIHVAIATVGRPALVASTVARLARQTRQADGVLVVSVSPADVDGVDAIPTPPRIAFAERGLCRQRNRALDLLRHDADIIVFFDDDFIPRMIISNPSNGCSWRIPMSSASRATSLRTGSAV